MSSASRKKRKRKRRQANVTAASRPPAEGSYARSRAKDEEARAKLEPLAEGERPTAVTVGAVVAAVAAMANIVALIVSYDSDEGQRAVVSVAGVLITIVVAIGMWRARYWAVLGMQTILALVLVSASLALIGASSVLAAVVLLLILAGGGTLFWFLIKAMARIQMPQRPSAKR
jgi:hypothetical protein